MSGTTDDLARRISTAHDLAGVVRSMKALAAASIGQYESAVDSLDGYYRTIEMGLSALMRRHGTALPGADDKPQRARAEPTGAVLFGSDQGLVGRFNEVLMEFAAPRLRATPGHSIMIWTVGQRMQTLAAGAATAGGTTRPLPVPASVESIAPLVAQLIMDIEAARERDHLDEVLIFHNRPKSAASYEPVCRRLLPLDAIWQRDLAARPWPGKNQPQVMDEGAAALEAFIREYLFVSLFKAGAESLASENASRLAAMQRAEKNIQEILEQLNGKFRRLRQETIDEELFEVIAGYESLSLRAHLSPEGH